MSATIDAVKAQMKELEEHLKDEQKRRSIEEVLDRFSKFGRPDLVNRVSVIAKYLGEIIPPIESNMVLNIVSQAIPDVNQMFDMFENGAVRDWAVQLNRKFVAAYEGIFPPFPHDWFRVLWSTSMNPSYAIPFIALTIFKRNGEIVYLEQPFATALRLIAYQLRQINTFREQTKFVFSEDTQKEIRDIQELTNSLLPKE